MGLGGGPASRHIRLQERLSSHAEKSAGSAIQGGLSINTRIIADEGGHPSIPPIQVRAQILSDTPEDACPAALADFVMTPEAGRKGALVGRGRWRQADVKRAIGAAEQAGLRFYRVDIAPDGTISIVVGRENTPSDR